MKQPTRKYGVKLIVETVEGNPGKWDWTDLIGDYAEVVDSDLIEEICPDCGCVWNEGCTDVTCDNHPDNPNKLISQKSI